MEPSEKLLFTRAEAAEMLSFSVSTLDVAVARGMLRARRNGRRVTIERREIERFSRTDHPHIWASNGSRGSVIEGRECGDCTKQGIKTPAVRFIACWPVCQDCFDRRRSAAAPNAGAVADGSTEALAEAR